MSVMRSSGASRPRCASRALALVADVGDPCGVHRTAAGAGLAADDHPVNAAQRESRQGTEQGLEGQEPDLGAGRAKLADPFEVLLALDADPSRRWRASRGDGKSRGVAARDWVNPETGACLRGA